MKKIIRPREILQILALAVVYFLAARFGLSLASATEQVTAVWPPTGFALAAVLIFGYRIAPGIAIGAFFANVMTNEPPLIALVIAFGNTLEALTGAYLLKRYAGFHTAMDRVRDVFWFLICAVLFSTMVSASIGVISLSVGGLIPWASFGSVWFVWWIGDLMGGFIFAPFLLVLWNARNDVSKIRKNWIEAAILALIIGIGNYVIFTNTYNGSWISNIRTYHVFLIIMWAAIRFGQFGAIIASFTTAMFALWATTLHIGPFSQNANTEQNLILLQFYLFAVAFTAQCMGAAMSERNRTQAALVKANAGLEETVKERTAILENAQKIAHVGSWEWDLGTDRITWSDELYRIFGVKPKAFVPSYDAYLNMLHPEDRKHLDETVKNALRTKQPFDVFHRVILPDGEIRIVQGKGDVATDADGKVTKMYGTALDVTQQKIAEDAINAHSQELERLNKSMVGRELKMVELKKEIEVLKKKTGSG